MRSGSFTRILCALPLLLLTLSGCSQLGLFNSVIPKDPGSQRLAHNVAYGKDARQTLDVYAPTSGTPKGTVVFIYGGSWDSGAKEDYGFVGKALASNGYTVVIPDYRLVPKVRYPDFVADTAKAVAWTRRNIKTYGGDADRLFLAGHSAGAYNAMMVAIAPEFLQAEGLSPAILKGAIGLSGPYDFLPLDVGATRAAFGQVRDLEATQPVKRVRGATPIPPVFLAHGAADTLVYPRNMTALATALHRGGHGVTTKLYPDIDHPGTLLAISRPLRDRAPALDDMLTFLAAH